MELTDRELRLIHSALYAYLRMARKGQLVEEANWHGDGRDYSAEIRFTLLSQIRHKIAIHLSNPR